MKPKIERLDLIAADTDIDLPPPQQLFISRSESSAEDKRPLPPSILTKRRMLSPTLRNDEAEDESGPSSLSQPVASVERVRKRVRMASPSSDLAPGIHLLSQDSQSQPLGSGETLVSDLTEVSKSSSSTTTSHLSSTAWQFHLKAPLARDLTIDPEVVYQDPYFSNLADVPPRAKMFAGRMFTLKGNTIDELPEFESTIPGYKRWLKTRRQHDEKARFGWEYSPPPPTLKTVEEFCNKEDKEIAAQGRLQTVGHS